MSKPFPEPANSFQRIEVITAPISSISHPIGREACIRLGADSSGKMIAAHYVAAHENSLEGGLSPAECHEGTPRLYNIANYHGGGIQIRLDRPDAGFMRCPFPHQACFAFESAVDELAYKLGMDPVALRL